jgi:diguanylate cyclase (GGDEF)-like protein
MGNLEQPVLGAAEAKPAEAGGKEAADARQALRVRRYLIGSATSLLMVVALFAGSRIGALPVEVAARGSAIILALILLFFALFRSGLNLRSADPSLTTEMIVAAIFFLAYIMYYAGPVRHALSLFYPVTLMFGVLRLRTRRLVLLAMLALAAHGSMLLLLRAGDPGLDLTPSYVHFAILALVLPWFAVMGGYVNALRRRLSDSNRELKAAFDRIEQIAVRDELTGLFNRRLLAEVMARESSRARRLARTYSVCLCDIDHFKSVNDSFGHAAGDAVLRHFALVAGGNLREVDVLGRYGGEEFLLVLPDTGRVGAAAVAERLRSNVEAAGFPGIPAQRRITVTVGVVTSRPGEDMEDLLARADGALYQGKAAGRNRVVALG